MDFKSALRRKLFIPLWVLKDNSPRLKYANELEKTQYYSRMELEALQFNKLKKVTKYAYQYCPYYKKKFEENFVNPHEINNIYDFKKIPILTKSNIIENADQLIAENIGSTRLTPYKTGGSTGIPITVYKDFDSIEKGAGSALRSFKWTGWNMGEPWGRVWGNPSGKKK